MSKVRNHLLVIAALLTTAAGTGSASAVEVGATAAHTSTSTAAVVGGLHCLGSGPFDIRWNSLASWNVAPGNWCIRNSSMRMLWQTDGNLVIYQYAAGTKALWASGTQGPNTRLSFQSDGNVVIYRSNVPVWASGQDPARKNGKTHGYELELERNLDSKTSKGYVDISGWDAPTYDLNSRTLWAVYNLPTPPLP